MAATVYGLPPRTRGSPPADPAHRAVLGSTPAYAGITAKHRTRRTWTAVYPRVRGDHHGQRPNPHRYPGLPPRTRGSHARRGAREARSRSTPAYAGITIRRWRAAKRQEVYPRVRGDHTAMPAVLLELGGLPPRTRGSLLHRRLDPGNRRSTPAYAGITGHRGRHGSGPQVYPRVRGDHVTAGLDAQAARGLPPRTRGSQRYSERSS